MTKCKAHLSKAERTKLDETGRFMAAGNERADELAKEGARDDSFQSILCDTYKAAKRVKPSHSPSEGRRTMARCGHAASRMGRER